MPQKHLNKLPHLLLQLNQVQHNPTEKQAKAQYLVRILDKTTIAPNQPITLKYSILSKKVFSVMCGIVEPKVSFEGKTGLYITSSLSRTDPNGNLFISVMSLQISFTKEPEKT